MSDPNQEGQPPPPPSLAHTAEPTGEILSTGATLTGIFFEPGRVFDALRARPRFLIAGLVLVLLTIVVDVALFQRVDMEQYIRDKVERSSRSATQPEEQKELIVKILKIGFAVGVPASVPFTIAAGAALYLLAVMAFGGAFGYKQSLAVWVYSSLPPAVLGTIVAVLVLYLKSPETIHPEHILITNPGAFMDADASPVLTSLMSRFDVLKFYGLVLGGIGLRRVGKLSAGSAWSIVIGFWLIGTILAVSWKAISGN
jgi:hypothetical protein